MKLLEQVATLSLPLHHCYYHEWYIVVTATGTESREIVSGRHDHIDNHDASASCVPVTRCPPQLRKSGQLLLYTTYILLIYYLCTTYILLIYYLYTTYILLFERSCARVASSSRASRSKRRSGSGAKASAPAPCPCTGAAGRA